MLWVGVGVALAAPIQRVAPAERALGVAMGTHWVPRDTTVRETEHACPDGQSGVEVVEVDAWFRVKDVEVARSGQRGCLSSDLLVDAAQPSGDPVLEAQLRLAFEERFGSVAPGAIRSTPWNRVALPMVHELSHSERQEEHQREGLRTSQQKERSVIAEGPLRDGKPIYAHFLGADAPRSDRWGAIATVLKLMALADAWADHCRLVLPGTISEANAGTCLLQFGDIAWYNDTLPDPLGHRTHYAGTCADIRLFRDTPSRYEAWWNRPDDRVGERGAYSRALTQAFLQFAMAEVSPTEVHFNDPAVVESVPLVTPARGHDDHIHMCF